jgi:hypothetical protein
MFFKEFDFAILHFQVFQENEMGFSLRIVPNEQFTQEVGRKILSSLSSFVGKETLVNLELVESIPLLITGKRTPVISKLRVDFQKIGNALFTEN